MNIRDFRSYALPIALGLLGTLLLVRGFVFSDSVLLPEDTEVVILVALVSVGMALAIQTIVHISMGFLRSLHIQQARRDTLAEHRRFLSRLDHELKNPLTAIRAGLKTLLITSLDAQQRSILDTMDTEILRLNRLVTDLRKLAGLETQALAVRPTHIPRLISNLIQLESDRFQLEGRYLESHIPDSVNLWNLDEDLLELALHNLLDNAFKYTRPGDHIRLEVDAQQELTIRVADTGIGILEEDLPHIWEELYRGKQSEKIPGSGIGLALVRAIVEYHNGMTDIISEVDKGTIVTLSFPQMSQS